MNPLAGYLMSMASAAPVFLGFALKEQLGPDPSAAYVGAWLALGVALAGMGYALLRYLLANAEVFPVAVGRWTPRGLRIRNWWMTGVLYAGLIALYESGVLLPVLLGVVTLTTAPLACLIGNANPAFLLLGYRYYTGEDAHGRKRLLLARRRPTPRTHAVALVPLAYLHKPGGLRA